MLKMIEKDTNNQAFIDYLQSEFKTNGKNLIVIGKPWVGKTYLCRQLIDHDYFISEPTFRQHIVNGTCVLRNPEEFGSDLKYFPLEALSKKKVIIFDDYGKGAVTDAYLEKMYFWLDSRIERGLRTVITTNLTSLDEFKARDKGIASRLMMNADIYVCDGWKDRRIKETRILNQILSNN